MLLSCLGDPRDAEDSHVCVESYLHLGRDVDDSSGEEVHNNLSALYFAVEQLSAVQHCVEMWYILRWMCAAEQLGIILDAWSHWQNVQ